MESPSNDNDVDEADEDDTSTHSVSPLNMTGGFTGVLDELSPGGGANEASPTHNELSPRQPDDDIITAPLTAPFDM